MALRIPAGAPALLLAALVLGTPPSRAQSPAAATEAFAAVDQAACLAAPAPSCLTELALQAARDEPEGWAITGAFEAFLAGDPDPAARDRWMARYEAWAATATIDGVRDRIVPVRAEHHARKGDFASAYRELGLDKPTPDTISEPSVLILDEARAGRVRDALARVDRLVESDSRDDIRFEILEIALSRSPSEVEAVSAAIRDRNTRRLAQAMLAGARGDEAIARSIDEWARGARPNQTAPFDDPDTARKDSWDMVLRGAIAAGNLEGFRWAVGRRPPYTSAADAEAVARILRPLMREGRADWVRVIGPAIRIPRDETVSVDEEVAPMRLLPLDRMLALAEAAGTTGTVQPAIIDLVVEMLATRGDVVQARDLFVSAGRLNELNRVAYDQDRVGVIFETLWRAVAGRGPQDEVDAVAARITSTGARAYMDRVTAMKARLGAILRGDRGDEPADDEWQIILDLAIGSGDLAAMAKVAAAIRDPGLRSTAFVQITRLQWERAAR